MPFSMECERCKNKYIKIYMSIEIWAPMGSRNIELCELCAQKLEDFLTAPPNLGGV